MKKIILSLVIPLAIFSFVVFVVGAVNASAQTTVTPVAVCPAGYTCTPLPPCPIGYTCTATAPQPMGCPVGYVCQLNGVTTHPNTPTNPVNPTKGCYQFSTNLNLGSTGVDVVALQNFLISNGYSISGISSGQTPKGYYSSQTQAAVKLYQAANGIPNTGFVGPMTRAMLNTSCGVTQPVSSITVLSPNGGEMWAQGSQKKITWNGPISFSQPYTQIGLYGPSGTNDFVGYIYGGSWISGSSYNWDVNRICSGFSNGVGSGCTTVKPGNYRLFVSIGDGSIRDLSESYFTITSSGGTNQPYSFNITYPTTGVTFQAGQTYNVKWNGSDPLGSSYSVYLVGGKLGLTSGTYLGTAVSSGSKYNDGTGSVGAFPWTIPADIMSASNYQIQFSGKGASGGNSSSFTIASPYQSPVPTPTYSPSYSPSLVPVSIIDETSYGNNGSANIYLSIAGYPTNKQVHHWVLTYVCPSNITLDSGKGSGLMCDGNIGKSSLTYYAYNMYDATSKYVMLSASAQNKNPNPAVITFTLDARDANDRSIGIPQVREIKLATYQTPTAYYTPIPTPTASASPVAVCPVGYICNVQGSASYCPTSYTCLAVTYNCPSGYFCMTYSPSPSAQPSITVLSPNGGEVYRAGDIMNIRWNATNLYSDTKLILQLSYITSSGVTYEDGMSVNIPYASTGSTQWVIPSKYVSGMKSNMFKIRAVLFGSNIPGLNSPQDYSDSYFTIISPSPSYSPSYTPVPTVSSNQSRIDAVTQLYITLLKRTPDSQGLNYWVNSSMTIDQIRTNIMNTAEYYNLNSSIRSSSSPSPSSSPVSYQNDDSLTASIWDAIREYFRNGGQ